MTRLIFALLLMSGVARAQNSDLGFLMGFSTTGSSVRVGSAVHVSTLVGAHGQINYAAQLKETRAGRLYLELPLMIGGHAGATVGGSVYGSAGGMISLTPGIRLNVAPHSRISFYAAAGAGPAVFGEDTATISSGFVNASTSWTVTLAADFGGGVDLRLSRLVSLRAEARDFLSQGGLAGVSGHHHPIYSFGLGFHW